MAPDPTRARMGPFGANLVRGRDRLRSTLRDSGQRAGRPPPGLRGPILSRALTMGPASLNQNRPESFSANDELERANWIGLAAGREHNGE